MKKSSFDMYGTGKFNIIAVEKCVQRKMIKIGANNGAIRVIFPYIRNASIISN